MKPVRELWVYIGRFLDAQGRLFFRYAQVTDGEPASAGYSFKKKLLKHQSVGSLLELGVTREDDGVSVDQNRDYKGPSGFEQVPDWIIEDERARDEKALEGKVKADLEAASVKGILAPLRKVYWRSSPTARAAIIGRLVYEITRPQSAQERRNG